MSPLVELKENIFKILQFPEKAPIHSLWSQKL